MINQRVKAFTIMEVIIAMLVTAILIGLVFSSYLIVSKSYGSYRTKNQEIADLTRLDEWLKKDFSRADLIQKDTSGILMRIKEKSVYYRFDPDYIIRQSARNDTFKCKTDSVISSFERLPVESQNPVAELNRIDELQFILLFKNEKIPYHYIKAYSSVNLINRNPNAVN